MSQAFFGKEIKISSSGSYSVEKTKLPGVGDKKAELAFSNLVKEKMHSANNNDTQNKKAEPNTHASDAPKENTIIKQTRDKIDQNPTRADLPMGPDQENELPIILVTGLEVEPDGITLEEPDLIVKDQEVDSEELELNEGVNVVVPFFKAENSPDKSSEEAALLTNAEEVALLIAKETTAQPTIKTDIFAEGFVQNNESDTGLQEVLAGFTPNPELFLEEQELSLEEQELFLEEQELLASFLNTQATPKETISPVESQKTIQDTQALNKEQPSNKKPTTIVDNNQIISTKQNQEKTIDVARKPQDLPVLPLSNLVLNDESFEGRAVIEQISKSQIDVVKAGNIEENTIVMPEEFEQNNNNSSGKNDSGFKEFANNFGQVIDTGSNKTSTQIAFDQFMPNQKELNLNHHQQIDLSIKHAVANGRNEVNINLYPRALGAVDVKIEYVVSGGVKEIKNITISAEKRETLDLLEKSQIELKKSLAEVTDTAKKEATLHFDMKQGNHQQGSAYFESFEERENWMNKFSGLTTKDIAAGEEISASNNYSTDSLDIRV